MEQELGFYHNNQQYSDLGTVKQIHVCKKNTPRSFDMQNLSQDNDTATARSRHTDLRRADVGRMTRHDASDVTRCGAVARSVKVEAVVGGEVYD